VVEPRAKMNLVHWKKWIAPQMAHLTDETNRAHIEAIQLNAFKCGMEHAGDVLMSRYTIPYQRLISEIGNITQLPPSKYEDPI
jgi:hypothetical protein